MTASLRLIGGNWKIFTPRNGLDGAKEPRARGLMTCSTQ